MLNYWKIFKYNSDKIKNMETKGTLNIEILITLMTLMLIFSMIISITSQTITINDATQNRKESRIIADEIANIIIKCYKTGDGYSKNYTLPETIHQETYIVKINQSGVHINSHYQIATKYQNFNTMIQGQIYLSPGKTYEFKNNNDTITITPTD